MISGYVGWNGIRNRQSSDYLCGRLLSRSHIFDVHLPVYLRIFSFSEEIQGEV
jgi:hypothetical protein